MDSFGPSWSATYGADRLRASKTTSSGTTYYYYDDGAPVLEATPTGYITGINVYGPAGLSSRVNSGVVTNYQFDPQGGVAIRSTSAGIACEPFYDAFGTKPVTPSTGRSASIPAESATATRRAGGGPLVTPRVLRVGRIFMATVATILLGRSIRPDGKAGHREMARAASIGAWCSA